MAEVNSVDERDFLRDFARYRQEARCGPVAVLSDGALAGYFIQPEDFQQLARTQRSFATTDLSDAKAAAISSGRMDSRHDNLNALLDEP